MMRIAARAFGKRVTQQLADLWFACDDTRLDDLEVLARVLFAPGRVAWRQLLQPHRRAGVVTGDAPRIASALGREHRLDASLEEVVVERGRRWRRGGLLGACRRNGGEHDSNGQKETRHKALLCEGIMHLNEGQLTLVSWRLHASSHPA